MLVKYWIVDGIHRMAIDDLGLKVRAHGLTKEATWEVLRLDIKQTIGELKDTLKIEVGNIQEIKGLKPGESKSLSVRTCGMNKKCRDIKCKNCILKDLEE